MKFDLTLELGESEFDHHCQWPNQKRIGTKNIRCQQVFKIPFAKVTSERSGC